MHKIGLIATFSRVLAELNAMALKEQLLQIQARVRGVRAMS